jgi:crotonobetainyl-CoA:carnitine CoA-transferase CaiB-like acyl-CoA transferase
LGDTGTGMLLAISVLGALYEQKATGKGQRLQVAMQDAMLHYIRLAFATQALKGGPIKRVGDQSVSGGNPPAESSRARAAARTITFMSTPAVPIPSTGSACWAC